MKVLIAFVVTFFLVFVALGYAEDDLGHARFLSNRGIIVDQTDNPSLYRFGDTITRAELVGVALLMKGVAIPEKYTCNEYYKDVDDDLPEWICRAVELAADRGLISRENELFRPHEQITRAEANAVLLPASGIEYEDDPDWQFTQLDSDMIDWQRRLYDRLRTLEIEIPGAITREAGVPNDAVNDIFFPIQGYYPNYTDTYGDPRWGGRTHIGTDVHGKKMTPLVAVVDGTISFAPEVEKYWGYAIYLKGEDGYTYKYLHVNNDTPGTDDANGGAQYAYAPGIKKGVKVKQGDTIAYLGDSGNSENISPHLHFEIETSNKESINPYNTLRNAEYLYPPIQFQLNAPATRSEVFAMAATLLRMKMFE